MHIPSTLVLAKNGDAAELLSSLAAYLARVSGAVFLSSVEFSLSLLSRFMKCP